MARPGLIVLRLCVVLLCATPVARAADGLNGIKPDGHAARHAARVVLASEVGAALDANPLLGGGTDDTEVLQRILDRAADGRPIHLILDGTALVAGLDVHGNSIIECLQGGGLFLKDRSNRAIVRNARRSRSAIADGHIEIRGCFLNGNGRHQHGDAKAGVAVFAVPGAREADGTFISGLQFYGVHHLVIRDTVVSDARAFAVHIANAQYVEIRNLITDRGNQSGGNTDGLHFNGPVQYASIHGLKIRSGDDGLAFNANDCGVDDLTINNEMGPYVGQGPITDVTVNDLQLIGAVSGGRMLSSTQPIDRVIISNVAGSVMGRLMTIGHFLNREVGKFGSIMIHDVNVSAIRLPPLSAGAKRKIEDLRQKVKGIDTEILYTPLAAGDLYGTLFVLNGRMERLSLRNVTAQVSDRRSILWIGPDAAIRNLHLDLSLVDPALQAVPIRLDAGSRTDRFDVRLNWLGSEIASGRDPVLSLGGTVEQWRWQDDAPAFIQERTGQ